MKKTLIASFLAVAFLSGCESIDVRQNAATGDYERSYSDGPVAFMETAFIGTGMLSWMGVESDADEAEKYAFLRSRGITVENGYEDINISFDEDVTFDVQKTELKPEFSATIEALAEVLKRAEGEATFEVLGHTDYTGKKVLNDYLGKERAMTLTEALISQGVNPESFVEVRGVNSSRIKDGCLELKCMRRVEVIIHKKDLLYNM